MDKNKFNNHVSYIKDAMDKDRLVIFVGSGISKDSGIPLWNELKNEILSYLDEDIFEKDPLKIAQILYNEKGEKEYIEIIKKILYSNRGKYNQIHELIFDLNPQHIITTNYDNFLEKVIEDEGLPYSLISKDEDLPYAEHKKLLIKYHGDFENHNIVLKENDYLNFSTNNTLKEVFAKSLFSNKVILFIGYSVSDPNIKSLIKDIQFILQKHQQRAYWLTHRSSENISNSEVNYFNDLGINIIAPNDEIKTIKKTSLSEIGNKVFDTLTYIKDFDNFVYRSSQTILSKSNPDRKVLIDELYNSLKRFYFFKVLPKKTIASIYPLNKNSTKKKDTYNIRENVLIIHDKTIFDLFKDYEGKNDSNYSDEEKDKLNYVLNRILFSGIYFFGKEGGRADSFGTKKITQQIELLKKVQIKDDCDCISCTIDRFEFDSAISKIDKYKVSHKTDLYDDIVYAYSLHRLGFHAESYYTFKDIVLKSNRENKYEVSFLAKYNQKLLSRYVFNESFHSTKLEYEDCEKIENDASRIDLDAELNKLKFYLDKNVFSLLKEIKEGVYVQRICNGLDQNQNEIDKTFTLIKRGGNSGGSCPFCKLENNIIKLNNFLTYNYIIDNGFSLIDQYRNRSAVSFIKGHELNLIVNDENFDDHFLSTPRIEKFDNVLVSSILDHTNPKELKKLFIEMKNVEEIQLVDENKTFKRINSFLKSAFVKSEFFNNVTKNHNFQNCLTSNGVFESMIKGIFNNSCLVTAYFNFNKNNINKLLKQYNHFLQHTNIELISSEMISFFEIVIFRRSKDIELNILLDTLKILNTKKIYSNCYTQVLDSILKNNPKFQNEYFDIEAFDFGHNNMSKAIFIYDSLSKTLKKPFKLKIEDRLTNSNYEQDYYLVISSGLVQTKQIKKKYIGLIKKTVTSSPPKKSSGKIYHRRSSFFVIQFIDLVCRDIFKESDYKGWNIQIDFYRFLFYPEKFNSKKFNPIWLKDLNHFSEVLKRLSKIDYVKTSLQRKLNKNFDEKLSKVYFELIS